jgi:hypothetical protein
MPINGAESHRGERCDVCAHVVHQKRLTGCDLGCSAHCWQSVSRPLRNKVMNDVLDARRRGFSNQPLRIRFGIYCNLLLRRGVAKSRKARSLSGSRRCPA